NDPAFLNAHPDPEAVELTKKGKMIEFAVAGGPNGRAFFVKAKHKTNKYLLVFQEWWGLNAFVKNEAAAWNKNLDINVLAIDLYDGKIAATADEAGKLMKANDPARSTALINGAMAYAGPQADFRTIGWCFGGGWSLQAAILGGPKTKACVMFYGMPESEVTKLRNLNTDVLYIHADKDQWLTEQVVSDFEKNMKTAGKNLTVKHYDADHAFANPSSPKYNATAAQDARAVVKAYLMGK
ncbi:MAG: dienelactone hydrolase family protein, partial [Saprospiraceae bacterium]